MRAYKEMILIIIRYFLIPTFDGMTAVDVLFVRCSKKFNIIYKHKLIKI